MKIALRMEAVNPFLVILKAVALNWIRLTLRMPPNTLPKQGTRWEIWMSLRDIDKVSSVAEEVATVDKEAVTAEEEAATAEEVSADGQVAGRALASIFSTGRMLPEYLPTLFTTVIPKT